ncbi:MAG: M20/M25/M40 family metallo-hydrolase [Candidatus Lokiarchaeota archaeon]|nr:M20/M25/M40 family metallo-hydrolase [Candidatus Lokiarchaeota archaeon]
MNEESSSNGEISVNELIHSSNEKFIEEDLIQFLQIPSYTLNREAIEDAKEFITSYISYFCEDIIEIEGEINPLLIAEVDGNIEDKLLIYMMYDTQPVNKDNEWIERPFGAQITDLPKPLDKIGKVIIARGAYNSKTPLISFLNVVKLLKKEEKLPISLMFLIDGEEEVGSPTLLRTLKSKKNMFKSCIDAYYPSMKQDLNQTSVLKLGYKGILSLTIRVSSLNEESHSAFSSMIPNPAQDLVFILQNIFSENKFKIKSLSVPYKMTKSENKLIDNLMKSIDLGIIKEKAGIRQTLIDDPKLSFITYLFNPTFNLSTLKSGYLENGIKNMVANKAECNIDIRFAHDISVNLILDEIKERVSDLTKNLKSHFEIIENIGYDRSKIREDSILVKSLVDSFIKLGFSTQVWPISAAAAPLSQIQSQLGLNFIVGGLGIGGYAHAPNEFVQVKSIQNTRLSNYLFLKNYSDLYNKK